MVVIGSFIQTTELELALSVLEHNGISSERIAVVPMSGQGIIDVSVSAKSGTLNEKAFELSLAFATALGVVGTSLGYSLKLGPLMWGVIFAFGGVFVTFIIAKMVMLYKQKSKFLGKKNKHPRTLPEITILVQCEKDRAEWVGQTMLKYNAIAIGEMEEA